MSDTHVALLRGVNVGGKNRLPMKDLVALFEGAGARDVRTYIQSGNVVFGATAASAPRVVGKAELALADHLGGPVPVVLRSARELAKIVKACPYPMKGEPRTLHVLFLGHAPTKAQVASLDPNRSPPDSFVVQGSEIYLSTPNGIGRSKLTNAWFDAMLATVSTARNFRTVLELLAMATRR